MDDAFEVSSVVLATLGSDRHLRSGSGLAKRQSKPIQLSLSGLSPGKDPEVDDDAAVLGERDRELVAINRHGKGFPLSRRELTPLPRHAVTRPCLEQRTRRVENYEPDTTKEESWERKSTR